jgi:hypothetical protein
MTATRWASRGEKCLVVTLGLFVSLGSPARALAQTPGAAGSSSWSFPDEPAGTEAPAEPAPPDRRQEPPAESPAKTPVPPPAEPPSSRPVESAPPTGPRFPVTVSSGAARVSIRGPGIETPLTCSGTCDFTLWEGTYWFDIQASGRNWTVPVTVTEPWRVVIEKPNAEVRGLGIAGIIVGGLVFSIAGFVSYAILVNCGPGGPQEGRASCNSAEKGLPYWLVATGAGAVVTGIGIALFVSNVKPSVELLPVIGRRARRAPETFVGLGSVPGSTLPGLTLQASF